MWPTASECNAKDGSPQQNVTGKDGGDFIMRVGSESVVPALSVDTDGDFSVSRVSITDGNVGDADS